MFVLHFGLSGWAVLATGALVASLLAVGASPAAAVEIDNSNLPRPSESTPWSACVGDALDDQGFVDVSDMHAFNDAINCLAYYGITKGMTADTYAPQASVSRWEMARFMERAADLTGADADDVLGDFEETGSDPVTRADMAVLLVKLLASAAPHIVQVDADDDYAVTYGPNGARDLDDGDGDPRTGPLDYFADARSETPRRVDNLISAAYELGITRGAGDGTEFQPEGHVTRGEMAAFITRTLGHTDVRPAGLSAQSASSSVQVSLRDSNYQPIVNEWIDVFYVKPDRVDDAFNSDGSCTRLPETSPEDDPDRCEVDRGDYLTQADGNVQFALPLTFVGDSRTLWTWTGDLTDEYEDGATDAVELLVVQGPMPATRALVSSNMRPGASEARYGSQITFTIQLQHYNSTTGAVLEAVPLRQDFAFVLRTTLRNAPAPGGDAGSGGLLSQDQDVITIGTDGTAEFVVTARDPRPHRRDNDAPREVEWDLVPLEAGTTMPVKIGKAGGPTFRDFVTTAIASGDPGDDGSSATREDLGKTNGYVTFDDDPGSIQSVTVLNGTGMPGSTYDYQDSGEEATYVTVAAINEYGEPVNGARVKVGADACDAAAVEDLTEYQTNRFGTARVRHVGPDGNAANSQTLTALYPGNDDPETGTPDAPNDESLVYPTCAASATGVVGTTGDLVTPDDFRHMHYWVGPNSAADEVQATGQAINIVNTATNEIVVGTGGTLVIVVYDDNDEFKVSDDGGTTAESKSMAKFVEALEYATSDSRITGVTLTWSGYEYRDTDGIAEWQLNYDDSALTAEPLG